MDPRSTSNSEQNLESSPSNDDNRASVDNDFHSDYIALEASLSLLSTEAPSSIPDEPISLKNTFYENSLPTFYEIIPSLQEISSVAVAVVLWRQKISLQRNCCLSYLPTEIYVEMEKLLLELPVPSLIREIIRSSSARVRKEIDIWFWYYKCKILTSRRGTPEEPAKIGDLLFCHWLPDGRIDRSKTASNMITNPRLTPADKFKIICTYCLIDEIEKFSAESLPSYITENITFYSNAMMYYWLCFLEADLEKIPKRHDESIASFMITAPGVDTWSAIEYFWNLLRPDERTSQVEQILDRRPEFQRNLLSKMSESQRYHIFSAIPIKIMKNFWNLPGQVRFAVSTWIYIRNFVDYKQFRKLMKDLAWDISSNIDEKIRCLVDILNHCPDHLKSLAFQPAIVNILIDTYTFRAYASSCGDIQLVADYLYFASARARKKIVFERADTLVSFMDPAFIDQLLKLCLPDARDVAQFKKFALESDFIRNRLCLKLQDRGFQTVNSFYDYYCTNSFARCWFCVGILERLDMASCRFHKIDDWTDLIAFVDENLLQTLPDEALKFKKRIAFSFASVMCRYLLQEADKIGKMMDTVVQLLDAKELAKVKLIALAQVQGTYTWEKFDENVVGGFISWCCENNGQRVREFKKILPIGLIFNRIWYSTKLNPVLRNDVDYETVSNICAPLDKCLHWYFEDPVDVKIFKLEKIFGSYRNYDSVFTSRGYSSDDVFSRNALPWFFDGDRDAVESFKKMYKNGTLHP